MLKTVSGLSAQIKEKLIQQALEKRLQQHYPDSLESPRSVINNAAHAAIPEQFYRFDQHPAYQQLRILDEGARQLGLRNPFFKVHDGLASAHTQINGKDYINFASYNYLGLCGDTRVTTAAKAALDQYGSSVSASRLVSGERPLHRELERALADLYEVDDAITFVSGHATNVSTIGHLFGPRDLIVHDEFIHNSALQGIQLSGAKRFSFAHNNASALDKVLTEHRGNFERVLILIEGLYSMDGDYPALPEFIALKHKHRCFLMVDEAHSLGVMGATGKGIREHFGLAGKEVDIWMGTLSKALAGCGGYIAGEHALVEHLKFLAPGFLYSVGMPPPVSAAAHAALQCLQQEPERVSRLQHNSALFLQLAQTAGINTGSSSGLAVIPAITGSSIHATRVANVLFEQGINVQPILYPAVPEKAARLRFFLSSEHSEQEIRDTVAALAKALK